jgi:U3 small nucleolar ribonucleoprotein component
MPVAELPDDFNEYYKAKAKDLPTSKRTTVDDLIDLLDKATIDMLNHGGSRVKVEEAFDAVLNHPDSTWSRDVLAYRQRQVHYK